MTETMLDYDALCDKFRMSRGTIYKLVRQDGFPSPRCPISGGRGIRWVESEVDQYMRDLPVVDLPTESDIPGGTGGKHNAKQKEAA
ncbi:AlpA family phage regulatory protein [Desulfuromonas acetoxidans]|uniref:helix-turn-helix transcriptional regulator n=1 Tax=Desulfuromonas acetoxidans TaxID=891 RepID=UPI00292FC2A4|nr:helix-turn-helix domain-containing protein [Desulfuromonas acetoxidans]